MRRLLTAMLLSTLLLASCDALPTAVLQQIPWNAEGGEPIRVYARKHDANSVTTGYGSCFAIRHRGQVYLLTAAHVVDEDGYSIEFEDSHAQVRQVKAFGNDSAVMRMNRLPRGVDVIDVCQKPLRRGRKLTALGFPQGGAMKKAQGSFVREGVMTCPIQVGMSGGPVLHKGQVVGVISTLYPELGVASYAPIQEVLAAIDRRPYRGKSIPVASITIPTPRRSRVVPRAQPTRAVNSTRYIPSVPTAPDLVIDDI